MTEKEAVKNLRRRSIERLIAALIRYANSGCLDASRFLCQSATDCLQGDTEECWRFYTEGHMVSCGFIQDYCDWDTRFRTVSMTKVDDDLYIQEKVDSDSGLTILQEVHLSTDDPLDLLLKYDRKGTGERLAELAERGDARAAYDLVSSGFPTDEEITELAGHDPRSRVDAAEKLLGIDGYGLGYDELFPRETVDAEEAVAVLDAARHAEPEFGYVLAVWFFAGRPVPRDTERALEYALDAAEDGSVEAAGLVAVMLDAPLSTDGDKEPDIGMEELVRREKNLVRKASHAGLFVPRRSGISPGAMLPTGLIAGELVSDGKMVYAYANDREVRKLRAGQRAEIILPDRLGAESGRIVAIAQIPAKLRHSPLLQNFGGTIPVYTDEKNPGEYTSLQALYRIEIEFDGKPECFAGRSVKVRILHKEMLGGEILKLLLSAFRREF